MRITLLIFCISIFSGLTSYSQELKKVPDSQVNKEDLKIAQGFASNYLTKAKNGDYYQFQNEAVDALKNQLTKENQKAIYQQLKGKYGDYMNLSHTGTWIQGNSSAVQIFRFKSDFTGSDEKLEVRIVLNGDKKIAGLWIKPWDDILK
jgi:hypothetical protein